MNNFEGKVKRLLAEKKMTIDQLAAGIEMTKQNLHDRFKKESIDTKHLEKIADFLDVNISYFFADDDNKSLQESPAKYDLYEEVIKAKDETIDSLKKLVRNYESQLNNRIQA